MNIIRQIKNKKEILAFIFASLAFICMIFMGPTQDTGDDAFLAWQLSREEGAIASFISPYLSLVLSWLYSNIPVAWWSIFSVCSGYILLLVVFDMIFKRYQGLMRVAISFIWMIFVWFAVIEKINFTRTATAYALAGIVLILEQIVCNPKRYWIKWVVGICLLIIGAMCRFQAALLVLPFFFIVLVYRYFWIQKKSFREFFDFLKINFIQIIGPIFLLCILVFFNNLYWNLNTEWKKYNHYNQVRSEIADYVEYYPSWEEGKNEYEKLGLKEKNDLDLLFTWVFVGDTDVYDMETLEGIEKLRREVTFEERIQGMNNRILDMIKNSQVLKWIVLYYIIYLLTIGKKTLFPAFISMLCATSVLVVFSFLGRMMLRVWEPTLLCCAMVMLVVFQDKKKTQKGYSVILERNGKSLGKLTVRTIWMLGIILVFILVYLVKNFFPLYQVPNYDNDRDNITRARAEYINEKQDRIYLLAQPIIHHPPLPSIFGIWEPIKQNFCSNYFALSNWEAMTPYNINRLNEIGIKNPVKALYERIDTYSIFDIQLFEFLKCHYNSEMTCSIVDSFVDSGMIVQYTEPIENFEYEIEEEFTYNLEENYIYEVPSVHIQGRIETDLDIEALYLNLIKNGEIISYRLSYEGQGEFQANLYDIDINLLKECEDAFLVAKNKNNENLKIYNEFDK